MNRRTTDASVSAVPRDFTYLSPFFCVSSLSHGILLAGWWKSKAYNQNKLPYLVIFRRWYHQMLSTGPRLDLERSERIYMLYKGSKIPREVYIRLYLPK